MGLTDSQSKALDEILAWYGTTPEPFYALVGYAGTGKSYLVAQLIEILSQADCGDKICLVAPTNKAVKVLQSLGTGCDCTTLHSLLGLRATHNYDTGKMTFTQDFDLKNSPDKMSIDDYSLVVIDESGMLNKELFELLKGYRTKFLFLGDDAQLPPVGEQSSIVWQEVRSKSYLTDVVRYSGNILKLATHLRNNLSHPNLPPYRDFRGDGVKYLNPMKFRNKVLDAVEDAIENDLPQHIRVLCYRNRTVDAWNKEIRAVIYGGYNVPSYIDGEWLIANEPIIVASAINPKKRITIHKNSDEFKIDCVHGITEIDGVPCWEVATNEHHIYICDAMQGAILGNKLNEISNDARSEKDKNKRRTLWRKYWELKEQFSNVSYNYAITVNKSQGSTYDIAAVDSNDIYDCRMVEERNRRAYTAFTRPRTTLMVY